jgi:glycosyltransferase involved in cell wall biosynthesis
VVPCYNHGQYIAQTIESIHNGSYVDYEIIIVDDGSADPHTHQVLAQLAEHPKVKVLRQPNSGPAKARNTGIAQAQGEFLFFVDADNWAMPTYIEQGVAVLQANPSVAVVYADALLVGEKDKRWEAATQGNLWKSRPFDLAKLEEGNFIDNCTVVRKLAIDQVGGYETNREIQGWEDWELWLRVAGAGWQFFYLDKPLFHYRTLPNSVISQVAGCEKRMAMLALIIDKHPSLIKAHYNNLARNYCKLVKTANDYDSLVNSREYRLGRAILSPIVRLKDFFSR